MWWKSLLPIYENLITKNSLLKNKDMDGSELHNPTLDKE